MRLNDTILNIFGPRRQDGKVGVEIELEGVNLPMEVLGWNSHVENSLRGENREYVTRGAVTLETLAKNLDYMCESFAMNDTKVHDAYRGSVHVHVNVQEKTFPQIFTTLFVWLLTEQLWLRLCGPTRDGNLFCLTSTTSNDMIPYCRNVLLYLSNSLMLGIPERGKYSSLNTDALRTFGSLEFRTFPSSCNPEKVKEWATWSVNLVDYGTSLKPDELTRVWEEALANPRAFYGRFFGKSIDHMDDFTLFDFAEQGAEYASDLILVWEEHEANMHKRAQPIPPIVIRDDPEFDILQNGEPDFDDNDWGDDEEEEFIEDEENEEDDAA